MRLRLLNLTYLVVALIAIGWVLFELYSANGAADSGGTAWSESVITALFNIPIVAGILIVLFALYKYPAHTEDQIRNKQKVSEQTGNNVVSPPLEQTGKKTSRVMQSSRDKEIPGVKLDTDISLNTDSTTLNMDSTTLDVDDYFLNPPNDDDHIEDNKYCSTGEISGGIDQGDHESLAPLIGAQTLVRLGENDHAVDMLLDAFTDDDGAESDAIAIQILKIINDELNDDSISAVRDLHLQLKKDEILDSFSENRGKLSDMTWKTIQMDNPIPEDSDYSDSVKMYVAR